MRIWILACIISFGAFADVPKLRVYRENNPQVLLIQTSDCSEIAAILKTIDVRFEQWKANKELPQEFNEAQIIEAYREDVDRLIRENGYKSVDVLRMYPTKPQKEALRAKFLNEHVHTEDEVRFFVEGTGAFYLHVEDLVYIVVCEKDDLISIPPLYRHWFDMGSEPFFTAIRFFIEPSGWIADFTGSSISQSFPKYGD